MERRPRGRRVAMRGDLAPSIAECRGVCRREPLDRLPARHRAAWTRLVQQTTRVDPRRRARLEFPAGAVRRPGGAAWRVRIPAAARRRGAGRHGILQSRDPPARRRSAHDDGDGRPAGRAVRRRQARAGGAGPLLHLVARSVVHLQLRRLLRPPEPHVGARAGHDARRAAGPALAGLRPPGRSRGFARGKSDGRERCAAV